MKTHFVISLIFLCFVAVAQASKIDSLSQELNKATEDSLIVKIQIQIAELLKKDHPDSSALYYNKAIDFAKETGLLKSQLQASNKLVSFYDDKNQNEKVIEVSTLPIQLAIQLKDSSNLPSLFLARGTAFLKMNLRDSALINYKRGIQIGEVINSYEVLSFVYNNRGVLYIQQGLFDLASESLIKSLENKRLGGMRIRPSTLLNIGVVSKETNNLEVALSYFKQALDSSIAENDNHSKGMSYQNIGALLTQMERFDEAIEYLNKSNEINLELNDSSAIVKYYIGLGDIYKEQGQIEECIKNYELARVHFPNNGSKRQLMYLNLDLANAYYFESISSKSYDLKPIVVLAKKAYNLSEELKLYRNKSESAALLFKLYRSLGREKEAVFYVNEHLIIQDSLFSIDKINALSEMQTKYETEKKEAEITYLGKENKIKADNLQQAQELQSKQKLVIILLIIGFILIGSVLLWGYRVYLQKKKANEELVSKNTIISTQKEEREILLKEIHHRVKNNLQVISSLLDLQSDNISDKVALSAVEDGQSRVKAMALIHQKLYQNEDIGRISFQEYTDQLTKQIASVYSLDKKVEVEISNKEVFLDIDTAVPLGLILNELVSNAYKHAFGKVENGTLSIQLKELKEGEYELEISDNGTGLPEDFEWSKAKSLGLRLVRRLSKQLYGTVEYKFHEGAIFSIVFKDTSQRKLVS